MEKELAKFPCPSDISEGRPRTWMDALAPVYLASPTFRHLLKLQRLHRGVVTLVVPASMTFVIL